MYNIGGNSETTNIHVVRTLGELLDERLSANPQLRGESPASPIFSGSRAASFVSHIRDRPGHRRYATDYSTAA